MDNVTFFVSELDGEEFAQIDRGNNEFTVMPKKFWDEQQAKQETLGINDAETL